MTYRTGLLVVGALVILGLLGMFMRGAPQDESRSAEVQNVVEETKGKTPNLEALMGFDYASGEVPLGDGNYTLDAPRKGYVYYCNLPPKGGGADVDGPWISGDTWNFLKKVIVDGEHTWADAEFTSVLSGAVRILQGNGLPVKALTGNFPIARNDEAYKYDRNPNSVQAQSYTREYPTRPTYLEDPRCIRPGEVGMMLNGVPLYDAFDAAYRDAPAHEVQDVCNGHPHRGGVYHYHNLSPCLDDSVSAVIGYAQDGYPITGPVVKDGAYLTTADLDICHGIESEVTDEHGKTYTTYHYVLTYDFPYSISCYRGK